MDLIKFNGWDLDTSTTNIPRVRSAFAQWVQRTYPESWALIFNNLTDEELEGPRFMSEALRYLELFTKMQTVRHEAEERSLSKARVYFVQNVRTGWIKIGWSRDVRTRLSSLRCGSSDTLRTLATEPGGLLREQELHRRFAHLRKRGEWFAPSPELLAYISTVKP